MEDRPVRKFDVEDRVWNRQTHAAGTVQDVIYYERHNSGARGYDYSVLYDEFANVDYDDAVPEHHLEPLKLAVKTVRVEFDTEHFEGIDIEIMHRLDGLLAYPAGVMITVDD